ncbi:MAG: hypothetical protein M3Y59_23885 [Myxococcota bacterium]|nr:hypothetical protein [Myxococcota bacterium]
MAQLTIYLPEEVERSVRREARRARKSVSAYLADLATARVLQQGRADRLAALCGSWEGEFPSGETLPPLDEPRP